MCWLDKRWEKKETMKRERRETEDTAKQKSEKREILRTSLNSVCVCVYVYIYIFCSAKLEESFLLSM